MKLSLPVVWVVFSLALSGCTQWYLVRPDMLEQVDIWLAEREYGKVLGYIESLPPTHSDYSTLQARLPEIGSMVTSFEKGIVGRAESLTEQKQWADALEVYDKGLARLPKSATINAARTRFLAKRTARLDHLRTEALLAKGDWLTRDTPLRREIARVEPHGRWARRRLKENSREVEKIAGELHSCGQRALAGGEYSLALECLTVAHALTPTQAISKELALAKATTARQTAKRSGKKRRRAKARASTIQKIVEAYEKAYANGDLLRAREHVNRLSGLEPDATVFKQMEADLDSAIAIEIQRGIETGRTLYRRGQIQPALDTWSELVQLEPENDKLNSHIARAQRVLKKLHKLQEKGTSDGSNDP